MSALQSKFNRLETQLGEIHQQIDDRIKLDFYNCAGKIYHPIECWTTLGNVIGQLSMDSKNNRTLHSSKLVNVLTNSLEELRTATDASLESDLVFSHHLSNLSWLVSAKASIQTLASVLQVFSENVHSLNEEIQYWEDIQEFDWRVGLYALQTSPFVIWQRCMESDRNHNDDTPCKRAKDDIAAATSNSNTWLRFYQLVQRYISPGLCSFRVGLFSSLSESKLEIQRNKRKLRSMRDFNASAVGLLIEKCLSFEADIPHTADGSSGFISDPLSRQARANTCLLKSILRNDGDKNEIFEHANNIVGTGDNVSWKAHSAGIGALDPDGILRELIYILTDLLPRYKHASGGCIVEFGRPSAAVRYWLPFSLAFISTTTLLKIARDVGPVLIKSISDFGAIALDFWKNWVVDPTWNLVRTIRHDERSEIALMSKNSLEADRASLERMVVDFVLDRGEYNHPTLSIDTIASRVREGDLTPVLRAYEKDLRSPFVGTFRGDLVRALMIQIQKTKVDVEVAMSGIDTLLKSQELVFGFVGLTPGLLISYASMRWFFGLLGNRKGFRSSQRQDNLRHALWRIHRIISTSSPMEGGRLTYRNHGLLVCNVEVLLRKAQTMLKGEDLRTFKEDSSDLINENRANKQLQIVERMAWAYLKWT
ncbi:ATP synthase regulation protein NCA2-domain-containing protein [Aspergillus aurantiobrunneus]